MVIANSYPQPGLPILVQINYINHTTCFFSARNEQDVLLYSTNVVAIFKCKPKP